MILFAFLLLWIKEQPRAHPNGFLRNCGKWPPCGLGDAPEDTEEDPGQGLSINTVYVPTSQKPSNSKNPKKTTNNIPSLLAKQGLAMLGSEWLISTCFTFFHKGWQSAISKKVLNSLRALFPVAEGKTILKHNTGFYRLPGLACWAFVGLDGLCPGF